MMAGTKRRRGGSPKKEPLESNSSTTASSPDAVVQVVTTLLAFHNDTTARERLWNDETAVRFITESFVSGKQATRSTTVESIEQDDSIGFVLLLASQLLERLSVNPESHSISMAWISYALTPLAIPSQPSLLSTAQCRHVTGRALCASAAAANSAFLQLTAGRKTKKAQQPREAMAIMAAVLALDRLLSVSGTKSSMSQPDWYEKTSKLWSETKFVCRRQVELYWFNHEAKHENRKLACWTSNMQRCWNFICGEGRQRTRATQCSVTEAFQDTIDHYHQIDDGVNSPESWVAMILRLHGEPRWLEAGLMLTKGPWIEHWSFTQLQTDSGNVSTLPGMQRSRKRRSKKPPAGEENAEFSGPVVGITLVSRLVEMLQLINKSSGCRFRDGLKLYCEACWEHKHFQTLHDVRDVGTMLIYELLRVHHDCLDVIGVSVINDVDDIKYEKVLSSVFPFLHWTLDRIIECTAGSCSLSLPVDAQRKVSSRLEAITLAFLLRYSQDGKPVDVRLLGHTVKKLVAAVSQFEFIPETSAWLAKKVNKSQLGAPSLQGKLKSQRRGPKSRSTFAGLFPTEYWPNCGGDSRLVLALRSMKGQSMEDRSASFLDLLLDLIALCYDMEPDDQVYSKSEPSSAFPETGDKKRPQKRRKLDVGPEIEHQTPSRLSETRLATLSALLDLLSLGLRHNLGDQKVSHLLTILRAQMGKSHMLKFVSLAQSLQKVIPGPSLRTMNRDTSSSVEGSPSQTELEKDVCISHLNACTVFGRGSVAYEADDKSSFLGANRLCVFKEIAESILGETSRWPLWLPPTHRAIAMCNLASESRSSTDDTELFIVEGAIESIKHTLEAYEDVQMRCNTQDLLSLDDVRLILVAMGHLTCADRSRTFADLIANVLSFLKRLKDSDDQMSKLRETVDFAGLIARIVLLCSNAYSILRLGPGAHQELVDLVGSSQPPSPISCMSASRTRYFAGIWGNAFYADDCSARFMLQDVDTRVEQHFKEILEISFEIGVRGLSDSGFLLFAAWNCLGKSDLLSKTSRVRSLPSNFELAGEVVPSLILELRNELCLVDRRLKMVFGRGTSIPAILVAVENRDRSDSSRASVRLSGVVESLLEMVRKGCKLLDALTEDFLKDALTPVPALYHCLIRVVTNYLCFAISMCTRPENDLYSTIRTSLEAGGQTRERTYSTESEVTASDGHNSNCDQNFAFEALEQLRDACEQFGAAPAHPDWLDSECSLLDGITPIMAIELGEAALKSINGLATLSMKNSQRDQRLFFESQLKVAGKQDGNASLIVNLCWIEGLMWKSNPSDLGDLEVDQKACAAIAEDCGVEARDVMIAVKILQGEAEGHESQRWCKSAAQRVQGKLYDLFRTSRTEDEIVSVPGLRAGGEWEIILARSLTSISNDACDEQLSGPSKLHATSSRQWLNTHREVVGCMTPITALIRFGLSGKGRMIHPLRSASFDPCSFRMADKYEKKIRLNSKTLTIAIHTALGILSTAPLGNGRRIAISHLLDGELGFPELRAFFASRLILESLVHVHGLGRTFQDHDLKDSLVRVLQALLVDRGGCPMLWVLANPEIDNFKTILGSKMNLRQWTENMDQGFLITQLALNHGTTSRASILRGVTSLALATDQLSGDSRMFLLYTLTEVLQERAPNGQCSEVATVLESLNEMSSEQLRTLVGSENYKQYKATYYDRNIQSPLAALCSFLLVASCFPEKDGAAQKRANIISTCLLEKVATWQSIPVLERRHALDLLFVSATIAEKLDVLVQRFLATDESLSKSVTVEYISHFGRFLCSAKRAISTILTEPKDEIVAQYRALIPSVCTYVKFSDFHEQHWYQCYTCGLTGDRGCCSLCAIVCHRGHDVRYARKSSFFCDCGAERSSSDSCSWVKCSCVTQAAESAVLDGLKNLKGETNSTESHSRQRQIDWIATSNRDEFCRSLESVFEVPKSTQWLVPSRTILVQQLQEDFTKWKTLQMMSRGHPSRLRQSSCSQIRNAIRRRKDSFSSSRDFATTWQSSAVSTYGDNTFDMNISSTKRLVLSRHKLGRKSIEADIRGRLIVAEANSISFCSGLCATKPVVAGGPRQSLRFLKSVQLFYEIIGFRLSPFEQSTLVVWGISEVSVVVMDSTLRTCKKRFDLPVDLKQRNSTTIGCHWLSKRHVLVASHSCILVHDIEKPRLAPTLVELKAVNDSCSLELRDFTVVPLNDGDNSQWRVFAVSHDASLYHARFTVTATCVAVGEGGFQQVPGFTSPFEDNQSEFPENHVRISYLSQSRILAYDATGFSVTGLLLDRTGMVDGHFELLPHLLPVTQDGKQEQVKGPYFYWRELGIVEDETSEAFFRIVCIGRVSVDDRPVLLTIDFNEWKTNIGVDQIDNGKTSGEYVADGCCVLSCLSCEHPDSCDAQTPTATVEKCFTCVVTSMGAFKSFEDDSCIRTLPAVSPAISSTGNMAIRKLDPTKPGIPLLSFEILKNITDKVDVFYHGGPAESPSQTRSKLCRDNDSFIRSPDTAGFTLNIANHTEARSPGTDAVAMVAIRLLLGATSVNSIPKVVYVQGSKIDTIPGVKRWYSMHMSLEDVLISIRTGNVSMFVSGTHDGLTSPVVDGLEVFGRSRAEFDSWIPTCIQSFVAPRQTTGSSKVDEASNELYSRLLNEVEALNSISELAQVAMSSSIHEELLTPLIREELLTPLIREAWISGETRLVTGAKKLSSLLFSSSGKRELFEDESILSGCADYVGVCKMSLDAATCTEDLHLIWNCITARLRSSIHIAKTVARLRPSNYLKASRSFKGSIALGLSKLLEAIVKVTTVNDKFICDFVELALLECAVARGFGADLDLRDNFAAFDTLCGLLMRSDTCVVQGACKAILSFCRKYRAAEELEPAEIDLFATQSMAVFYQCDGCGSVPIQNVRFSLEDEDHPVDLCRKCYKEAHDYATLKGFNPNVDVVFEGGGDSPQLTCAEVGRMRALPIERNEAANSCGKSIKVAGQDALSIKAEVFERQQLFGDFIEGLITTVVNLVIGEVERQDFHGNLIMALIYELSGLVAHASTADKVSRLTRKMVEGLSKVLHRSMLGRPETRVGDSDLRCIRRYSEALNNLVVFDYEARDYMINRVAAEETSCLPIEEPTEIKCDHGLNAVVRRVAGSGRKFYCCQVKSKAYRCDFFSWTTDPSTPSMPLFQESTAGAIWRLISKRQDHESASVLQLLSHVVKIELSRDQQLKRNGQQDTKFIPFPRGPCESEISDGVLCGWVRLSDLCVNHREETEPRAKKESSAISQIFDLVALTGDKVDRSPWKDMLCNVLFSPSDITSIFESVAKRALFRLCGRSSCLFLEVRDTFLFEKHFSCLWESTRRQRSYASIVNRKALMQNTMERHAGQRGNDMLRLHQVVCATDLLSEDVLMCEVDGRKGNPLDELLAVASKRPRNWKAFCSKPPPDEVGSHLNAAYPLLKVLSLPALLIGDDRCKAMKLASLATATGTSNEKSEDSPNDVTETENFLTARSHLSDADLRSFVSRFICREECQEVRRHALKAVKGLCPNGMSSAKLFVRLLNDESNKMGEMGKSYHELFGLLNFLAQESTKSVLDVPLVARQVQSYAREQCLATFAQRFDSESYHFETRKHTMVQKHRFELSLCGHISSRQPSSVKSGRHVDQVSPFIRVRLSTAGDVASSDEFNQFISLPCRSVVSEIHVDISEPRGRFVKTLNFFYSPRPVQSPARLKDNTYESTWKPCGTVSLEKGVESTSYRLVHSVTAANIRVEFHDFYDRPGSPKEDGFVVHCPRCMRSVTNAHGVCGSCGEVAFQCRKCRHINYDRLNAYLCVECGYCTSGTISYEVTAAVATNAIAITCDRDYEEARLMFEAAVKIRDELRDALRDILDTIKAGGRDNSERKALDTLAPTVQRAFEGKLPLRPDEPTPQIKASSSLLNVFTKRGSVVKFVARKRKNRESHTSSLPLRSDHAVLRHIRSLDTDDFEDASDLLGILENSVSRGLDPSDPVSRLLASVQRQRERNAGGRASTNRLGSNNDDPKRQRFEECEKLYRLMHEAQRESFALKNRLEAWNKVERGDLLCRTREADEGHFQPCTCSACSALVAQQLLLVWQRIFHLDPERVPIEWGIVEVLLSDDLSPPGGLADTKREILKDIALHSSHGRTLILGALKYRMTNLHCAEIVGSILKEGTDEAIVRPFLELAMTALEEGLI